MAEKQFISKLADIPLARPGFDALDMTAPTLVQLNPDGKWENCPPNRLDEDRLKTVVQHLINSKAVSAALSYCCQCAAQNKTSGTSNYVPIIMMPIYPASECPFDMDCEVQKIKEVDKPKKKTAKATEQARDSERDDKNKKMKKRGFVLQRFTDFDLLSQW